MEDKKLTFIIIGNKNYDKYKDSEKFNYIKMSNYKLVDAVLKVKTDYVGFIDSDDNLGSNYFTTVYQKLNNCEFDSCFINYNVDYDYQNEMLISKNTETLNSYKPRRGEYIWAYIYKTNLFKKSLLCEQESFDEKMNELFYNSESISDVIYMHKHKGKIYENEYPLKNRKESLFLKNIIYVGDYCNCIFNGYVSWLLNIGKAFAKEYKITILYNNIPDITIDRFKDYFILEQYDPNVNYVCENLTCTYSTYFFPKNIFWLVDSCMFIHGNMSDYDNVIVYTEDIYSRYIAVSKLAAEKAVGYFPTDNIEYIYNPYVIDRNCLKPHLKLVSAQRNSEEKRVERIAKLGKILNELEIPFTWNVFMDSKENLEEVDGVVYRECSTQTINYVNDANYVVLLGDTESFSYILVEALANNIKVICTNLEICDEVGAIDKYNACIIPREYFNEGNEELLRNKVWEAYCNIYNCFEYDFPVSDFSGFTTIFKK